MQMPQGPAMCAAIIVAVAVLLLGGLTVAFKGSVQF